MKALISYLDHKTNQKVLGKVVEYEEIRKTTSGEEAIIFVKNGKWDLVVLRLNLISFKIL